MYVFIYMQRTDKDLATNVRTSSEIYKLLTLTNPTDAVEDVASLTLTAVGAQQVDTTMPFTDLFRALTLINICGGGRQQQRTP